MNWKPKGWMLIFCLSFILQKLHKISVSQKIQLVLELSYSPAKGSLSHSCSEIGVCGRIDGFMAYFPYQEYS